MSVVRILFLCISVFSSISFYGKKNVNDYKYVIVPERYGFLKKNDEYQLNSLSKFLFNKYGFQAFIQGEELPEDLINNGCLGLRAEVKKNSGLFVTKFIVELKDCNGTVVFSSSEGASREKDYKKAYHEALRDAFKDVKALNYKYTPKTQNIKEEDHNDVTTKKEVSKPVVSMPKHPETNATPIAQKDGLPKKAIEEKTVSYIFNDNVFIFKKEAYGYELLQNNGDTQVSIGKLFKSNSGNSYIVKAGDLSGNGYFDNYQNFVLERINPVTNKLITDIFARQ
ncbi:hypothetical protein [Aquimarina sp. RZ0]|uniref:hypothetical protein n=1 Tax=Aquimarina sp. RZ0 TaxID=2607730 RepID=UPI0011F1897A|nr:hypothetical protein [Aquimarina sp. RZ0]KAA1245701.1 hypothetical protein F0000_10700 [Aquimarina sp. RZ0]